MMQFPYLNIKLKGSQCSNFSEHWEPSYWR